MEAPDTLRVEAASIGLVLLFVVTSSILFYHLYVFYRAKSDIFDGVNRSLTSLWTSQLQPLVDTWLLPDVGAGIQVTDSFESEVEPVVENLFHLLNQSESGQLTNIMPSIMELLVVSALCGAIYFTLRRL